MASPVPSKTTNRFWPAALLFAAILLLLFIRGIWPGNIVFSNDSPLGAQMAASRRVPDVFSGGWQDLNSIGYREGGGVPDLTYGFLYLVGPLAFSKFYAPFALLTLGFGAWLFFRKSGLSPVACLLGGLAAMLNSIFFSVACWGIAGQAITAGLIFFALAAVVDSAPGWRWVRIAVAGVAVGLAVTDGADVGAIFSLYVAAFVIYHAQTTGRLSLKTVGVGIGKVALIAIFAALVAAQTIHVLVGTQIKGVAGMTQDEQTKQERWDWATQWSLPKREALGFIVPGLFGYRMDTPEGGTYWGAAGRDPAWYNYWANGSQGPQPQGFMRFSGGGFYAGALVVVVAFWAALQSFRRQGSVFSPRQRSVLLFWVAVVVISLPLAFGRFAPFYRILYELPYFSTIRNPGKFLYPVSMALVILFAYGINALSQQYMTTAAPGGSFWLTVLRTWWQRVRGFDRRWTQWSFATLGGCFLSWLIYASSRQGLEQYLQQVGFDTPTASSIAGFSYSQVGWFIITLALAIVLITLVLGGVFKGQHAKWGGFLMGLFICVDLGRANLPWIVAWDYRHKYETNPVIDSLREKPYEHRVAILPRWFSSIFELPKQLTMQEQIINYLYGIEWSQHLFLYYDIQSLDVIQMPRKPEDLTAYDMAFTPVSGAQLPRLGRQWELTNTRYLIGLADFLPVLNQTVDPVGHSFRYKERFTVAPKPGYAMTSNAQDWTAVPDTNGPFAVFELTNALPRVKLFSDWEMEPTGAAAMQAMPTNALSPWDLRLLRHAGTNGFVTLQKLASASFDAHRTVLIAPPANLPQPATNSAAVAGKVEFSSYAPKHIVLKAEASAPSVLLLNDRYDPDWKVLVDGKTENLLKCNFLMRGVFLQPGQHKVEFVFQPAMGSFYVSLAGAILGALLCGFLLVVRKSPGPEPVAAESPGAQEKPKDTQARKAASQLPKTAATRK